MSNAQRIGLIAGMILVLVGAYLLLAPGDDETTNGTATATATTPAVTTTTVPATTATTTTAVPPAADHEPAITTIRVSGGKPVGGVEEIAVKKGERARFRVASQDTSDEIHVHGYDIYRDLTAPGSVTISFVANADGIFEVELHGDHTQIAELRVEP